MSGLRASIVGGRPDWVVSMRVVPDRDIEEHGVPSHDGAEGARAPCQLRAARVSWCSSSVSLTGREPVGAWPDGMMRTRYGDGA